MDMLAIFKADATAQMQDSLASKSAFVAVYAGRAAARPTRDHLTIQHTFVHAGAHDRHALDM